MIRRTLFGRFFFLPRERKGLAVEVVANLLAACALTAVSPRRALPQGSVTDAVPVREADLAQAQDHATMVVRIADRLPFLRARCLQRAVALRWMLRRRGLACTVNLALMAGAAERKRAAAGRAHAWVSLGSHVLLGGGAPEGYVLVARLG